MGLIKKAVDISIEKMLAYPHEIYMIFLHSLLSITVTILFWQILFSNLEFFSYSEGFIYVLAMLGLISDGISELFFGLRDFEHLVRDGSLDTYLYRPRNTIYMILLERIPLVSFLEKLFLGTVGLVWVACAFDLQISFLHVVGGMGFMILGVLYYQLVYGIITILSLWVENISKIRNLIFQFSDSKKYPISIFPNLLKHFLTYVVPISLLAYYPATILLGMGEPLPQLYLTFPVVLVTAVAIYGYCIKKYSSNGG